MLPLFVAIVDVLSHTGTGCFTLCNVGDKVVQSKHGLLSTVEVRQQHNTHHKQTLLSSHLTVHFPRPSHSPLNPHSIPLLQYKLGPKHNNKICYALEGSVPFAGACIEWLVKRLELIPSSASSEALCDSDDNGGVYFVPAFSGLYAPYWRDDARGVIVGLTRYSNKAHLVRAALEAVCFQTKEVCDAMRADAQMSGVNLGNLNVLKVDGGMTVNALLMNMQCNILDCEVQRPRIVETTALGAAYVAGLATGYFQDVNEVSNQWKLDKTFVPDHHAYSKARRDQEFARWKRAIKRTLNWTNDTDPNEDDGDNINKEQWNRPLGRDAATGFATGALVTASLCAVLALLWHRIKL